MLGTIEEIKNQLALQCGLDGSDADYEFGSEDKVIGDLEMGSNITVWWEGNFNNRGVVIGLPGYEEEDPWLGGLAYFASSAGPGDMDDCPVWVTVDQLLHNPMCTKIVVRKPR